MKIKCLSKFDEEDPLTVGRIYDVVVEDEYFPIVLCDNGEYWNVNVGRFEVVEAVSPAPRIFKCVSHEEDDDSLFTIGKYYELTAWDNTELGYQFTGDAGFSNWGYTKNFEEIFPETSPQQEKIISLDDLKGKLQASLPEKFLFDFNISITPHGDKDVFSGTTHLNVSRECVTGDEVLSIAAKMLASVEGVAQND